MEIEQEDHPKISRFPLDPSSVGVGAVVYKAVCVPIKDRELRCPFSEIRQSEEAQKMHLFSHPNVLCTHWSFNVKHHFWVVIPFMSYRSFHIIVSSFRGGLLEDCMTVILKETLKELYYLHHGGYIHGDVKSSNILFDSNGCIKLVDYRASRLYYGQKSPLLHWVAPEVIKFQAICSSETDVRLFDMTALVTTRTFSEVFQDMVGSCLDKNSTKRPSADELLKHPFFERCKGSSEFHVKNLLRGLPSIEQRFKSL